MGDIKTLKLWVRDSPSSSSIFIPTFSNSTPITDPSPILSLIATLLSGGRHQVLPSIWWHDENDEGKRLAILIAGSNGYSNCRHQDYVGEDVTVNNFFAAILGNKSALSSGSGKVVDSGPNDQILIFYPGHDRLGLLGICLEACESGSIFEGLLHEGLNIYATTSASRKKTVGQSIVLGYIVVLLLKMKPAGVTSTVLLEWKTGQRKDYEWKFKLWFLPLQYGDIENSQVPPSKAVYQRDENLIHFWDMLRKALVGSSRKTAAQKQILEVRSH